MSTKQRPRPLKVNIPIPGGWNPDATESSIPKSEYIEARNMRKAKSDEWEARSGISEFLFAGAKTPVCAAEYRLDDQFANVIIFEEGGHLSAIVFDGDRAVPLNVLIPDIVTAIPAGAAQYEAYAAQFNTFLIVTVYNVGVFALTPSGNQQIAPVDLSVWDAPILLGKYLTPSPNVDATINPNVGVGWNRFKEDVSGDIIVFDYVIPPPGGTDFVPQYGTVGNISNSEPIKYRVPCNAPYKRIAGNAGLISTNLLKQFETDSSDGNLPASALGIREHLHKRGCFYRFIVKSRYINVKGQKLTYYHEPSVDIYVPDNDYAPPFLANKVTGGYTILHDLHAVSDGWYGPANLPAQTPGDVIYSLPLNEEATPVWSTHNDVAYLDLQAKWRSYFHVDGNANNTTLGVAGGYPYYFATRIIGGEVLNYAAFSNKPPYKISVPVSELLSAPLAIFNWSDFVGLPADAYEIEVHRTAYIDSPDFAPSVYGQCGVIKKDGSFTDDVKDTALDFNGNIDRNTGYLQAEFSGKVLRVYSNNIRLGNITDKLKIRTPSNVVQAFGFNAAIPDRLIPVSDLTVTTFADGGSQVVFGYQYLDNDDNASDLMMIGGNDTIGVFTALDLDLVTPPNVSGVAFTFPHGYNDTIESIYVFEGHWIPAAGPVAAHREWRRIGIVPTLAQSSLLPPITDNGHLVYVVSSGWAGLPLLDDGETVIAHDPGSAIWSQSADMDHWPPENYELEHQFAPITFIGNSSGPALMHTDQSINMTDFGVQQRWEEIHDAIGCIGRFAAVKVGRVEFFLSSIGMQMSEGQGLRTFPASVQSVVLKYLHESIPGVPRLTNARRASLGWLGQRNELHLRFPSSADLGTGPNIGKLPAIDIVFRLYYDYGDYSPKDVQNYRFDLYPSNDPGTQAFFIASPATGRLFAVSARPSVPEMSLIEMDVPEIPWAGDAYLTIPIALGLVETKKELSELLFSADADCLIEVSTGMKRTDGLDMISTSEDLVHGPLKPECEIIGLELAVELDPVTGLPITGLPIVYSQTFRHEISKLMENIGDRVPCIRIHTAVNTGFGGCIATGNHLFRLKSMEVEATIAEEPDVRHI